jgi:hypothetical protein
MGCWSEWRVRQAKELVMPNIRVIRRYAIPLTVVVVFSITILAALGWIYLHHTMRVCASHTVNVIVGPGMYDAEVIEEGCDGVAGYDAVSVIIRSRDTKRELTVFSYEMDNTNTDLALRNVFPIVQWLDKNHLTVSVRAVGEVDKKLVDAEGVNIAYRIGIVEFR